MHLLSVTNVELGDCCIWSESSEVIDILIFVGDPNDEVSLKATSPTHDLETSSKVAMISNT